MGMQTSDNSAPLTGWASEFRSHKLIQSSANRWEFRPTWFNRVILLATVLFALWLLLGFSDWHANAVILVSSTILIFAGILYYSSFYTVVFDRENSRISRGYRLFGFIVFGYSIPFKDILAFQLMRVDMVDSTSYQLNIVLKDRTRHNVLHHDELDDMRRDMLTLSRQFSIPVHDST